MIGSHLGERYELTVLQQEGPIFACYSAKDKVLGREVTVRIVKPPFSAEYRFVDVLQEVVKRAGSVKHPNVERMIDLHQEANVVFLVSEVSRGASLTDRIRKLAPYSTAVAVGMAMSVLDGLEAIHNSGYTHGDAGSHSIIVQPDGSARVMLPGLWEAYAVSETANASMLPAMATYLAPEVASGAVPTPASDTYAVGVILFELLTGRQPYSADTPVALAMKHSTAAIPSARALNPAVPTNLDDVVRRALAKDPSQRYPDASKMLSDLRKIEDTVRFGKAAQPLSKPAPAERPATQSVAESKNESTPRSKVSSKKAKATYVEEKQPRDVPIWMTIIFTFFLAVAVSLVGVWYFFTMSAPKTLVVPDLVGKPRDDARQMLDRMKLTMRVERQEPSEKYAKDTVINVEPGVGQQVREGGTVQVRLSSGSRLVSIPDLRGRSLDDARTILQRFNLELDRTDPIDDPRIGKGLIVRQMPESKTKVERFTRVNVWISTGPPEREVPPPSATTPPADPNAKYVYRVSIKLTKILDPVVLRVDITDANGTRKVHEAEHFPNEVVTIKTEGVGAHAVFRIYYNGQYVTQKEADSESADQGASGDRSRSRDNGDDETDSIENYRDQWGKSWNERDGD